MTTTTLQKYAVYFDDSEDSTQIGVFTDKEEANQVFKKEVAELQQAIKDGEWDELYEDTGDYPDVELALVDDDENYTDTVMFWNHSLGYHTP